MPYLILGLLIFLSVHSVRIVAEPWRTAQVARFGLTVWKRLYGLASVIGLVVIVWGYAMARAHPVVLWVPPVWTRHVTALLTALAFVLFAAAYLPANRIRAAIGDPMVAGVAIWALAHLLSNGVLAGVILFGAFLVWAVADFAAARRRDERDGIRSSAGIGGRDATVVVVGLASWALFAFVLHGWLIGVRPFA